MAEMSNARLPMNATEGEMEQAAQHYLHSLGTDPEVLAIALARAVDDERRWAEFAGQLQDRLRDTKSAEQARKAGSVPYPKTFDGLKAMLVGVKNDHVPKGVDVVCMIITTLPSTTLRSRILRKMLRGLMELGHTVVPGPDLPSAGGRVIP